MGEVGGNSKRMVVFILEVWRMVTASSYLSKLISQLYVFVLTLSDPGRCDPGFWNMDSGRQNQFHCSST